MDARHGKEHEEIRTILAYCVPEGTLIPTCMQSGAMHEQACTCPPIELEHGRI